MYQTDLIAVEQTLIMSRDIVKDLKRSGHIMVVVPNQVFFVAPRLSWEICNDPPGNPKNFWLTEKDIEALSAYGSMNL